MESLFSLEVIVNYVKLNTLPSSASNQGVSCLFPCVAFRLLDYPSIAINLLDSYDAKQIKNRLEITAPFDRIEKLPCFTELLDKHGRYIFSRGKSCLFRSEMKSIRGHLKNTPMYLLLLDTFFEPYKLVGTTLVPLTNLINEIYEETYENNEPTTKSLDTPCTKMTHGVFEIKNLMGEEIGHISFACRLTSFGTSLLPHIDHTTTEAVQRRQQQQQLKSESLKNAQTKPHVAIEKEISQKENVKSINPTEVVDYQEQEVYLYELRKSTSQASTNTKDEKIQNQNVLVQTVKIDYKDAQVQISDYPNSKKTDKSTQSPTNTKRKKLPTYIDGQQVPPSAADDQNAPVDIYKVKHCQDEFVFNHYCPPAMHYNSNMEQKNIFKTQEKSANQQETLTTHNSNNKNQEIYSTNIRESTNVTTILNQKIMISKRIEYLNQIAKTNTNFDDLENDEQAEIVETNDENIEYYMQPTRQSSAHQLSKNVIADNKFNFDQMPLLKCLFEEMSLLKNLIDNNNNNNSKDRITSDTSHAKSKMAISNDDQRIIKNVITNKVQNQLRKTNSGGGILRQTTRPITNNNNNNKKMHKTKSIGSYNSITREEIVESVNRLSQPRTNTKQKVLYDYDNSNQSVVLLDHDEIPVGVHNQVRPTKQQKTPLKYGTTNTHRMRVLANRPGKIKQIDQKHKTLISQVKTNIDELNNNNSSAATTIEQFNETMQKNLEKVLFESVGASTTTSSAAGQKLSNTLKNTNQSIKSGMNFSLLNKVEMESTNDHTLINTYGPNIDLWPQNNYVISESSEENNAGMAENQNGSHSASPTKMVQFGNTYVMNTSFTSPASDESGAVVTRTDSSSNSKFNGKTLNNFTKKPLNAETDESSYSTKEKSSNMINKNIFLNNRNNNQYDDDFHSSLDTSQSSSKPSTTTTTSNFFTNDKKALKSKRSNERNRQEIDKHAKDDDDDDDDNKYGEIEYLGAGYQSELRSSSKLSSSNDLQYSYNTKSFIDESLSQTNDSSKSGQNNRK